ncbi:MAG: peptidoglycan bridge formation glycyltransferase FemA/FemB family protein [Candidatus Nomurabacteria bacterium]|jgi:lipid II:glycine glycyltransferase (peptidoglycan interpeptide bridge formation enzyme)|nr:peptidoglycan bridge formation glycyltransferase FemA/FemB family protein [Candidatus Nomurabacteria bacterium]
MTPHFLQTKAWRDFKQSEGIKIFSESTKTYSYTALQESTPLGNYFFVPYGPTLSDKSYLKPALTSLKKLAKSEHPLFIRIEPTLPFSPEEMSKYGLKKTKNISPEHTQILDLTSSESDLLSSMKPNNRNLYRNHTKKGITITTTKDPTKVTILTDLMRGVSAHNHFHTHSPEYLKNQLASGFATLYVASLDQKPIAAALVYDTKTTRYYAQAAADYTHRNLSAGTILVVKIILDAKKNGQKTFDFWGITPSEDPKHPWYGFTKFKKSFGGTQLTYSGTYDLPVKPLKYQLYRLIRSINLSLRRLKRP